MFLNDDNETFCALSEVRLDKFKRVVSIARQIEREFRTMEPEQIKALSSELIEIQELLKGLSTDLEIIQNRVFSSIRVMLSQIDTEEGRG